MLVPKVILFSKGDDKVQILSVASSMTSGTTTTPLFVCKMVCAQIEPLLLHMKGPVRGKPFVVEIRNLAIASRDRHLAEAAA